MGKTISLFGFSSVESPAVIKDFLEEYTGEGSVYAVEVCQPKKEGSRTRALVQFTDLEAAEMVKSLAESGLWYKNSYLKYRDLDQDIVSRTESFIQCMNNIVLNLGCQTSKEKISVLWTQENVSVNFGFGMRRFYFFLSYLSTNYKLELSYENIRKVELRFPPQGELSDLSCRQPKKFLLIQLIGAPKIFKQDTPTLSYFKEAADNHWTREVDFTPSCCIGQSSVVCLEIPPGQELPNFGDNLFFYKESRGQFTLEKGSTFSCNSNLVPIVDAPEGFELPYQILFKVNALVQHGFLPGAALDASFFRKIDPSKINAAYIEEALDKLSHQKECCYDPTRWLHDQYLKYMTSGRIPAPPVVPLDDGLVYIRRVQVTPSKIYFSGPEVNLSNRVLRNYPDDLENFIRVSFVDEDLDRLYSTNLLPLNSSESEGRRTNIYQRILSVQRNGIVIGNKKFEFLGFSHSQLRENSLWMFASRPGLTAADIRNRMGDLSEIKNVAKYAARLGQSFSSSRETFNVGRHEIETIPDVEVERGGVKYVFSDGIGKISAELAQSIVQKLGFRSYTPSAFQIRYGGYKGVVAVDPTSSRKLSLRKSMCKYKSENSSLDVLGWSKYQRCFLNRQVITLLSTLGVNDSVFEMKQREAVAQLDAILTDPLKALDLFGPGENTTIVKEMIACGYMPDAEPFLSMMLQTFRASQLLDMRTKTKILLADGRCMMGCMDETGTLHYGQVFIQYSRARNSQLTGSQDNHVHVGRVVVAKNPCLHPGDIRILKAVNVTVLHHMVDCVVFPQKGKRPHPNECSGSDLDGDVYFVCWDRQLIPPMRSPPMDYTTPPTIVLDHDVTIKEVQEYFTDYILNDSLGIICNAHTVYADKEISKALSKPCVELAKLSSVAVDFPKTGVPAKIPPNLRVKEYPDFMEKPDKPTYISNNVIGKLFRAVKDAAPESSPVIPFTKEAARRSYDYDMEVDGFEKYVDEAFHYKTEYDKQLGNLMDYYGIKTEAEILSGWILKTSKSFDRKRDRDSITFAVRSLRKQANRWFSENGSDLESELFAKASAWYHVTYHPSFWGRYNEGMNRDHFISFPWCAYDKLIDVRRRNKVNRTNLLAPQLNHSLRHCAFVCLFLLLLVYYNYVH
ncbi:hypothetical protein K2173_019811 [Erythroxylum novogranatense]|uniref:RNA-dependent RNA polymerase n=1 Tax=Erythroxylum novogranatense TaxID=1862640 RepID=A0AAV8SMA0_9ROSI|nr:hypothetical protein K2173_019811 [Erythroxylum novogranatense]